MSADSRQSGTAISTAELDLLVDIEELKKERRNSLDAYLRRQVEDVPKLEKLIADGGLDRRTCRNTIARVGCHAVMMCAVGLRPEAVASMR